MNESYMIQCQSTVQQSLLLINFIATSHRPMLNSRPFDLGRVSTHAAQITIDQLLQKGASELYDHYLTDKVPAHAQTIAGDEISTTVRPVHSSSHPTGDTALPRDQQAVFHRVQVRQERRSTVRAQASPQKSVKASRNVSLSARKEREGKRKNRLQEWREMASKAPSRTRPNHCIKNQCAKLDLTDQQLAIWGEKCISYDKQQAKKEQLEQQSLQKQRWRAHLEKKFNNLTTNNKPIVFDDDSGQLLDTSKVPSPTEPQKPKARTVMIKYDFSQSKRQRTNRPDSKDVKNVRKVTSFARSRTRTQDQQLALSFSNNDQRQVSTIPLMELEEGVKMSQDQGKKSIQRETPRPQTSRPCSNLTTRTFKSYTQERMQSSKGLRTISYSVDMKNRPNSRYMAAQQPRKSSHSILWSNRSGQKNHHITKDEDLITDYFDFNLPTQ